MEQQNRADRFLIATALVIIFLTGTAYYFDGWMWGGKKVRGARIGNISSKSGDVRVKFEGDLRWGKAARGQDLTYNDAVYAGSGSQAELALGKSQMTVQENTLVVLRREENVSFLNLDYGTLFGKVAEKEKIMIDTGNGRPIEFLSSSKSQIVLRKNRSGKTELNVISGNAQVVIDGKTQSLGHSSKIVLDEKSPVPEPRIEKARLIALKPLKTDTIYSPTPTEIPFRWEWSPERPVRAEETFTLEFSSEPTFRRIHARKVVTGRLDTTMRVSKSLSLYYRVRGPRAELSQVEAVHFVRLEPPVILKPIADQRYLTPAGQNALVEMEFAKSEANVWYQVSSDLDFNQILLSHSTASPKAIAELAAGSYFVRARHDHGQNRLSDWSRTVAFKIDVKLDQLRIEETPDQKIIIPNKAYPAYLYRASNEKVRSFLAKSGFLKNFFPLKPGGFDKLNVAFEGQGESIAQSHANWPTRAMAPGTYQYKYQALKTGFEPSPIIGPKKLEIGMEAPRALGSPVLGEPLEDGSREARWQFTPLLFAHSYDVEVARHPSFRDAKQLKTETPSAVADLEPGSHFWRVRARDEQGRLISDYSATSKIEVPELVLPPALAQKEPEPEREPAAAQSSVLKMDNKPAEPWVRNGWWAWLGSGYNYVDYRQSVQERGTITSHSPQSGSQYLEGGFNGSTGWGGVVSYKATPGKISVENAVIDKQTYTWSTVGFEGLKRALTMIPWTQVPVVYGFRVGVQQHKTPFLFLDADTNLKMQENKMSTASVGLLAELQRRKWTYYFLGRYQYPFSSSAGGSNVFQITPQFAFDGSVGTSYNVTGSMKLGLFWYGQWHQYNFVYGDADVTNTGFQSLFYSNVDLRLGFEF